jgi:hypothetical protein
MCYERIEKVLKALKEADEELVNQHPDKLKLTQMGPTIGSSKMKINVRQGDGMGIGSTTDFRRMIWAHLSIRRMLRADREGAKSP